MSYEFFDPCDVLLRLAERIGGERRGGALVANIGELQVRARYVRPTLGDTEAGLEVVVTGSALPARMVLSTNSAPPPNGERRTGDPSLDRVAGIGGDLEEAMVCLGPDTRLAIVELADGTNVLVLYEGALRLLDPRVQASDVRTTDHLVRRTIALATLLARADDLDIGPTLLVRAFEDPVPEVRWNALELLVARAGTLEADPAIARALASDDLVSRVIAAPHAGERGVQELLTIVTSEAATNARLRALQSLETLAPPSVDLEALLISVLDASEALLVREAARALGERGTLRAVEPLHALVEKRGTPREIEQAALAAVRAIQTAHGGEPGRLSLDSASDTGALSFAESAEGALSVSRDGGGLAIAPPERPADDRDR